MLNYRLEDGIAISSSPWEQWERARSPSDRSFINVAVAIILGVDHPGGEIWTSVLRYLWDEGGSGVAQALHRAMQVDRQAIDHNCNQTVSKTISQKSGGQILRSLHG
jgi:hypothetical protein